MAGNVHIYQHIFLAFSLFAMCLKTFSQNDLLNLPKSYKSFGIAGHTGFIIPHSKSIRSVAYSKPWIIETDFSWHFITDRAWQYCSCYPRVGVSFMYINFDNPDVLGRSYTLAPYVEPFLTAHRKFSLSIRFAGGISYLDNVYDPNKNPDNLFYSTHISFLISASTTLNCRISSHWNLRVSGCYNHISNGGNRIPNKGINFPTAAIGLDYLLSPVKFYPQVKTENEEPRKRSSLKIGLFGTGKKPFNEENTRYLLYGCHVNWIYLIGRLSALTIGLEYVNDGSIKEALLRSNPSPPDHKRAGFLAGHELQVGRFRFSQQLGIYLYSPVKAKDPVYQRWGLDFLVTERFYTGVNLKAHRHVADFTDFRVGFVW